MLLYREPRTLERIYMAFRPSKRPSSSASRREQRKASGNAALAAGGIISALMEDAVT